RGGVVAVVLDRHAVLEVDRMFGGPFDRLRSLPVAVLFDGPLRDVDVVGAPVGHFAAGVLVPPADFVVATRRLRAGVAALIGPEGDKRRLAEPPLPVEFLGRIADRDGPASGSPTDGAGHFPDVADAAIA